MNQYYELSYPVNTVKWNGTEITSVADAEIIASLEILKECGISQVMLSGYTEVEKAAFNMFEETRRIGSLLKSMNMKGAQHHGLAASFAPLNESQNEVIEKLINSVRFTANLYADVLVIHPGRIAGHHQTVKDFIDKFEQEKANHGLDKVIKVNAENLYHAGEEAEKLGIKIALENVDRFEPLGSMELLPRLIEAVNHPAVGYCLDSGHAHCCGYDILAWLEVMGEKLFTTHFHDNRGACDNAVTNQTWIAPVGIDEHLPPGFGTICWRDVIRKLREIGYTRTINFESGPWPGMLEKDGYLVAVNYWRTNEYLSTLNPKEHK